MATRKRSTVKPPRQRSIDNWSSLSAILGSRLTPALDASLAAAVEHARWLDASDRQRVTPKDRLRARRRLRALAEQARGVLSMLEVTSFASWRLHSVLAEAGLAADTLETLKSHLTLVESSAKRAHSEVGTYTVRAESNVSGKLEIVSAGHEQTGRPGRRPENARSVLAVMAGMALETHGVRIAKTRGGTFERVLRVLCRQSGLSESNDVYRTIIRAVDHVRWIGENAAPARRSR